MGSEVPRVAQQMESGLHGFSCGIRGEVEDRAVAMGCNVLPVGTSLTR